MTSLVVAEGIDLRVARKIFGASIDMVVECVATSISVSNPGLLAYLDGTNYRSVVREVLVNCITNEVSSSESVALGVAWAHQAHPWDLLDHFYIILGEVIYWKLIDARSGEIDTSMYNMYFRRVISLCREVALLEYNNITVTTHGTEISDLLFKKLGYNELSEISRKTFLPVDGAFFVVHLKMNKEGREVARSDLVDFVLGHRAYWRYNPEITYGFFPIDSLMHSSARRAIVSQLCQEYVVGVSSVGTGLASIPALRGQACLAAKLAHVGTPVFFEERIPGALLISQPDIGVLNMVNVFDSMFNKASRIESELLLETLAAWFAAGGKTSVAARIVYCHRNTVLNRVRKIERLTCRSLSDPKGIVELYLALEMLYIQKGRKWPRGR